MFDRDDPAQIDKVRRLFNALVADAKRGGLRRISHPSRLDGSGRPDLRPQQSRPVAAVREDQGRARPRTASSRPASRASGLPPIGSIGHDAGFPHRRRCQRLPCSPACEVRQRQSGGAGQGSAAGRLRAVREGAGGRTSPTIASGLAAEQNGERMFQRRCGVCHLEGGMGTMVLARRLPRRTGEAPGPARPPPRTRRHDRAPKAWAQCRG